MVGHHAWRSVVLSIAALTLASLACSLGAAQDTTRQTVEEIQKRPLVVLLAPVNGSTFAEGVQVEFHAIAQDTLAGVARIEFRIDDTLIGEVASDQPDGQPSLEARVDWVASGQTGHLITVEAFRADGASLGFHDAGIKVVEQPMSQLPSGSAQLVEGPPPTFTPDGMALSPVTPGVESTPIPTPTPPIQSDRPVAQVDAANLNVRQGPGTNYPAVGFLSMGDQVDIVGRNADSSWWAVAYANGTAWIFAGLTVTSGNVSQVPLVAAPPPPAPTSPPVPQGPADLVIDSVRLDPPTPQAGVLFMVYAVVRNAGYSPSPEADAMLTFQPGDERSPADPRIPALQPGQSTEIFFRVTLQGSGTGLTGVIDIDTYNAVNEGPAGEANNRATVTYNVNP